jgi:AraC-like DNA-binding protein
MPIWSTDSVSPHERFDYWRAIRSKNIFSTEVEIDPAAQARFYGRYQTWSLGGATLGEMHALSYLVRRTRTDIARTPHDNLYVYQPMEGSSWFDRGDQGEFAVAEGELALTYSDQPYANVTKTAKDDIHLRVLTIPLAVCRPFITGPDDLLARPLAAVPGIEALAVGYFNAFVAQAPHLSGAAAEVAVRTLAQLVFMARGVAAPGSEPGREAVRAARLVAARNFIDKSLQRADLTPAVAARALGISVRALHALFEPSGTSFARYLLARRLDAARLLLARDPCRPITDIAFACGIDSLPTFYRNFRRAFGMTPSEYRGSLTPGE